MGSVRVAIVGVGNCAASLVQGVEYYKDADPTDRGAVADADDGYANRTHSGCSCFYEGDPGMSPGISWGAWCTGRAAALARSESISSLSQRTSRSTDSRPCFCSSRV